MQPYSKTAGLWARISSWCSGVRRPAGYTLMLPLSSGQKETPSLRRCCTRRMALEKFNFSLLRGGITLHTQHTFSVLLA